MYFSTSGEQWYQWSNNVTMRDHSPDFSPHLPPLPDRLHNVTTYKAPALLGDGMLRWGVFPAPSVVRERDI